MNSNELKEWVKNEKATVGKCYEDLLFGIDNLTPFKEGTDIENRYFFKNINVLDKYMNKVYEIEEKINKTKKVFFMEVSDFDKDEVNRLVNDCISYKREANLVFKKLEFCRTCKCLECVSNCKFSSCNTCELFGKVTECDKEDKEIVMFKNTTSELFNSETNVYDTVKVLAQVRILSENSFYRVIESDGEFLILTYSKSMDGKEVYGEVTDEDVFNYVAEAYERNLSEVL